MARTLQRDRSRLRDKSTIEWLSHEQRAKNRTTLKFFREIITTLEGGKPLPPDARTFMSNYTGSDNIDTWLNSAWSTLDKQESHYLARLAAMAQHDLAAYHEFIRPDEPPAPHQIMFCEELMKVECGEGMFLGISASPGSAKSTYGSRSFVQWFMGRNPNKRVLAVGHGQKFCEDEFSKPNRNQVDTEEYRTVFPDVFLSEDDRGATSWKLQDFRGLYACRGANAGVAGLRAGLLSIDDPIKSVKEASSQKTRDDLFKWVTSDLFARRLPGCPIVYITTRYYSDDPLGRLEEIHKKNPNTLPGPVKFINISAQALADDPKDDPLGRKKGEWLWEEFYGAAHYESLRETMSPSLWSALYLGIPIDKLGEYVAEDEFKRYDTYPRNNPEAPIKPRRTVISIDTAQKSTERSAFTAMQVFIEGSDNLHYLVHAERVQNKLDDVVILAQRLVHNWSANYILIEDAGQGSQIIENYATKMSCPVIPYSPKKKGSKEFAFDAAVPWITSGRVLFPKQAGWLTEFMTELISFPDGKYKDHCDAFAQYCSHALSRRVGGTKKLVMAA